MNTSSSRSVRRWLATKGTTGGRVVGLALLGALAFPVGAGAVTPRQQAKMEFDRGQIQYRVGHFQDALEAYTRAYELFPAAALLFNIGQCHKNLRNYERAIFFFEGYLHDEVDPGKRALANELIAESRTELERRSAPAAAAPQAGPSANAEASKPSPDKGTSAPPSRPSELAGGSAPTEPPRLTPVLSTAAAAPRLTADSATSAEQPTSITRTWWFWTALGVVALGLGGGLLYAAGSGGTTHVAPSGSLGTLDRR